MKQSITLTLGMCAFRLRRRFTELVRRSRELEDSRDIRPHSRSIFRQRVVARFCTDLELKRGPDSAVMRADRGLKSALDLKRREIISVRNKSQTFAAYLVRFTCCPPLLAMLNCKAGVLRESRLTLAKVSHARVNRHCAAFKRFSQ